MKQKSRDAIFKAEDKSLYSLVVELSKEYLKLYPKDTAVLCVYAQALRRFSRFGEAEEALEEALKQTGETSILEWIFVERGHLNCRKGDYIQAEQWYGEAMALNPVFAGHFVFIGVAAFKRGDLAKAGEFLRKGIACEGLSVDEAYFNLGGVLTAQERYEEACECYRKALEIDPDYRVAKYRIRDVEKVLKLRAKVENRKKKSKPN